MRPSTTETRTPPEPYAGPMFVAVRCPAAAPAARLMLTGELDLVTADRAHADIAHAQDDSRVLICDLADLWFIDLTGLRVLLDAAARAERTGRRLIVANAPPIMTRMLGLLGLDDALEVPPAPLSTQPVSRCATFRPHVS